MKKAEEPRQTPATAADSTADNPAKGMVARMREQLIEAELQRVSKPNAMLVRGTVGKATVAVGYASPVYQELTVMREFRFTPLVPVTDPKQPGLFRAWNYLRESPRPATAALGHTVWLFLVHPMSISGVTGINLTLPPVAHAASLGSREAPLHGTTAYITQLPREKWGKALQRDQQEKESIRRVFALNKWIPLERQVDSNWLSAIVEFIGDVPHDFDGRYDRLLVTLTARPAALGWMSNLDAKRACEAARAGRQEVVTQRIAASAIVQKNNSAELAQELKLR